MNLHPIAIIAGMACAAVGLGLTLKHYFPDPVPKLTATDNPKYVVQELFTHDGCKVNSFMDGRTVWFVVCPNGQASAMSVESCGKGCTRITPSHTWRQSHP